MTYYDLVPTCEVKGLHPQVLLFCVGLYVVQVGWNILTGTVLDSRFEKHARAFILSQIIFLYQLVLIHGPISLHDFVGLRKIAVERWGTRTNGEAHLIWTGPTRGSLTPQMTKCWAIMVWLILQEEKRQLSLHAPNRTQRLHNNLDIGCDVCKLASLWETLSFFS